jgi:hypothetical protein
MGVDVDGAVSTPYQSNQESGSLLLIRVLFCSYRSCSINLSLRPFGLPDIMLAAHLPLAGK